MGDTSRTWQGLLQRVVEANNDIVSTKRLKGHLDRLAEKYPPLEKVSVTEGRIELRDGFPEDASGLVTVCTILGALYWTLDMFTGPTTAAERIRKPVREFIDNDLPPGAIIGLNKFLPKLHLERPAEGEPPEEAPRPGEGAFAPDGPPTDAADALEDRGGRAPAEGRERELWERSTENGAGREAQGAGDGGGGETGSAELPGEELAGQYSGTVPWLGEEIPQGCSLLVEGPGEAKERCCLRFLGEGLAGGESVLALIAYAPDEFRRRMAAEGYDTTKAEEEGRLRMLDWATFRERHIRDLEDDGPVMRLPMELPWVGSAINMALSELPESASPRAFVNILPRALATVAIETVFNFVQVTILKFKRKKMTGLFIMEEEKDPEKSAIRLSFNSWVDIGGDDNGGNTFSVRLGGPILRPKLKTVRFSGGKWAVVSEQAIPPDKVAGLEPPFMGDLRRALGDWRSQGYDVSRLEEALKGDPKRARELFERFGQGATRLRTVRSDLKIMDLSGFEGDAARVQQMLRDVWRVDEAEAAMAGLRRRFDLRKAAAKGTPEAPGTAGTAEAAGPAPQGGSALPGEPEGAPGGPDARVAADAYRRAELRKEEEAVRRAQEKARRGVGAGEPSSRGAAPAEEKRAEFREALAKWKDEGYAVGPLEGVMDQDLEQVRRDFLLFRVQLQRLRELGDEISELEAPALAARRAELEAMLRDPSRIHELEAGVEELRSAATAMADQDRQRREQEQRRRTALSEDLFWWSSHGLRADRLEKLLDGDLAQAEREFAAFEPGARRLLKLREELASLDTSEFRDDAARLESLLCDVDQLEQAEREMAAFKDFVAGHSRDARERKALGDGLELWKAKGFRTEAAERALGLELETARSELSRFNERAAAAEELLARLSGLDPKGFEDGAGKVRDRLLDPSRLEEGRVMLASLMGDMEKARAAELERAGYRGRIEQWKKGGLATAELEGLLDKDILVLRKAVVDFQFRLDTYKDLVGQLEPLARTGHAAEAVALRNDLKGLSRLPELEEKVLALRALVEAEALASGRELSGEFDRDLANMEKVRGWIAGGIPVRRLEGALAQDRETIRSEIDRYEHDLDELTKESSALEVLDTKGLEKELALIRSMLNDPDKLPVVRALRDSLRTEISRLKKQEERRSNLRGVAMDWEQKGYRVKHLHEALEKDIEKAASDFVLFQTRITASEHLRRRLDALELLGMGPEAARLRRRLAETDSLSEVSSEVDRLWRSVEQSEGDRTARRKEERKRKLALRERLAGWLERGMNVQRLEGALVMPVEEAEAEFSRFEGDERRLRALEERLGSLDARGFEPEVLALRSMLNDVGSISELEQGLQALGEKVQRARSDDERRKEREKDRRAEEQRRSAVRAALEERLGEWAGSGLNVDGLRTALATDLSLAEKRFAEFEGALRRGEELRAELRRLESRGLEGVAGADTIERMLLDPLDLPRAERAFAEFRQRAGAHIADKESQMREYARRIRELESPGEDVSALKRAFKKGLADVRDAFAEHDRTIKRRDLEDTWMGIKSKVLRGAAERKAAGRSGAAGEGQAGGGGAGAKAAAQAAGEGPSAGGEAGARVAAADAAVAAGPSANAGNQKRKVRKLRKEGTHMQEKATLGETERTGYEKKLAEWESEGFDVGRLAAMLRSSPQDAPGAFETAEKGIVRLRELARELQSVPAADAGEHLPRISKLLHDPWMSAEAESLFMEMQVHAERRRKEELRHKREHERKFARLRDKVFAWKAQGFVTAGLEKLLERDPDAAEKEAALFGEAVARLTAAEEELRGLEAREHESERSRIQQMLRDTKKVQEAEEAIIHLRVMMEKDRRSGRLREDQARRERAALRERVEVWRASGLKIPLTDDFLDHAEPDALRARVEEMEEAVARLAELQEELERMGPEGLITEKETIRALLKDPKQLQAAEERMLRLHFAAQRATKEKERRQEESRRWRKELQARVKEWRGAGYDTLRLDGAFDQDDETLKKEWGMFRIQLKHVQELETELMALPSEGIEQEVGALVSKLRKVNLATIGEVESAIQSIKGRVDAKKEAELRAREAEKREKQELVAKVMRWVEEGYRDGREGRIERLVSKGLPAMREEVRELEARIMRMEEVRKELEALDITGFETEAAMALEELHDLSRVTQVEGLVGELKERVFSKRDEERRRAVEEKQRREEFRSKIMGWKKLGFNVSALEDNLGGDIEFLRKEYSITRMRIQKAQELIQELGAMPADEFGPQVEQARHALYSLDRIPESEEAVGKLRVAVAERARQKKKLEELRGKLEDWREQGYDVSRLERVMEQDVETVTKEFLMFKIRIQKLRELEEELRSLDTEGFDAERAAIERDLHNIDRLGEIRDRLSELELNIGKRMAEEVRVQEERRKLQGDYMAKMSAWLEEGFYVDPLEGALGKSATEMAADFKRFEDSVAAVRQIRERLEELTSSGYEELIARIREKLRDVSRLDEAKRDIHELWERIERRKKEVEGRRKEEDDLRFNIVKQIEAWDGMGYDVRGLEKRAGGRMEDLRRAMINFRMKIERMQGLQGILEAMDTRGFEKAADAIRARMKEIERVEDVEGAINALKEKIQANKDSERVSRERQRHKRDACTDRFLALVSQGYNVDSIEGVLELPYEELSMECERIEGVVARLKEIGSELGKKGIAVNGEVMRSKLTDIHALPELEELLATGRAPGEPKAPAEKIHVIAYGHGASPKEPAQERRRLEEPEPRMPQARAPPATPAPEAAEAEAPKAPAIAQAPVAAAPELKCGACGEPIEPAWKKCPSCLNVLGPAAEPVQADAAPAAVSSEAVIEKTEEPVMDRIPATPERDMGIRDEAASRRRTGGRGGKPLDPDKLVQVRNMIEKWKGQGYAVGELEEYLGSGVVTKEGIRVRLEAINERIKNAAAPAGKRLEAKEREEKEQEAKEPAAGGPDAVTPDKGEPEASGPQEGGTGKSTPEVRTPQEDAAAKGEPESLGPQAEETEKSAPDAQESQAGEPTTEPESQGPEAGETADKEVEPREPAEDGERPPAANGTAPPNGKRFKKVKKVVK